LCVGFFVEAVGVLAVILPNVLVGVEAVDGAAVEFCNPLSGVVGTNLVTGATFGTGSSCTGTDGVTEFVDLD